MTKFFHWISRDKLVIFALVFIFFIGLFLRLYRLADFTEWQDSARDYMVGESIFTVKNDGWLIAPLALGSVGYFNNTPIYYYMVGVLVLVFHNPLYVASFVAILGNFTILLNFLLAKKLGDDKTGLLAAGFTAFSFILISQSISLFQPNFIPFFISLFLLCLALAYERKSFFWFLLSIFIFWSFFHLHYSFLIIVPSLIFSFIAIFYRICGTAYAKLKISYLLFVFLVGGLFWYSFLNLSSPLNLLNFIYAEIGGNAGNFWLNGLLTRLFSVFQKFIGFYLGSVGWRTTTLVFISIIILSVIDFWQKKQKRKDFFLEIQLILIFLSLFLFSFFSRSIYDSYFIIFFTLVPILLAQLVWVVAKHKKWTGLAISFLILGLLNHGNERLSMPMIGLYEKSQSISELIIQDMEEKNIFKLSDIFVSSKNSGMSVYNWFSPKYWYFLEKKLNQKNTIVTRGFNNLSWTTYRPSYVYLVCENESLLSDRDVVDSCLNPYKDNFSSIFEPQYEVLKAEFADSLVYVLTIKSKPNASLYWPFSFNKFSKK
ncbi:hypothetical protein KJZ63_03290 [Patescibacteria group bacterium]|nr:hypothetical protein [Patescibacteria group bacterium]